MCVCQSECDPLTCNSGWSFCLKGLHCLVHFILFPFKQIRTLRMLWCRPIQPGWECQRKVVLVLFQDNHSMLSKWCLCNHVFYNITAPLWQFLGLFFVWCTLGFGLNYWITIKGFHLDIWLYTLSNSKPSNRFILLWSFDFCTFVQVVLWFSPLVNKIMHI